MKKTALIAPLLLLFCSTGRENFTEKKWAQEVQASRPEALHAPHFRDGEYFNPWMPMQKKGIGELLFWKLTSKDLYTEEENKLPQVVPGAMERIRAAGGRDFILWVGHNTFLVRVGGRYWITDPVFSNRVIILGRKTKPGITMKEMNLLTEQPNIIITHNHHDHLDEESIRRLPAGSRVFTPLGLKDLITGLGKKHVRQMDWWQEYEADGMRLVCLPAQHWSRRIGQGYNETLWAAFLLITPSATLFFGGDSGYFIGYREIGRKYPGIDYALIPVTAYHPRWFMHYAHMDAGEAIEAFRDLGAKYFIPTQWGTFHLGDEPPGYTGIDLVRKIGEKGVERKRFLIMKIGELVFIDGRKRISPFIAETAVKAPRQ